MLFYYFSIFNKDPEYFHCCLQRTYLKNPRRAKLDASKNCKGQPNLHWSRQARWPVLHPVPAERLLDLTLGEGDIFPLPQISSSHSDGTAQFWAREITGENLTGLGRGWPAGIGVRIWPKCWICTPPPFPGLPACRGLQPHSASFPHFPSPFPSKFTNPGADLAYWAAPSSSMDLHHSACQPSTFFAGADVPYNMLAAVLGQDKGLKPAQGHFRIAPY